MVAGVRVYRSNRAEVLVDALVEVLREPPGEGPRDPFADEWVVVPGRGMGVWLAREIARRRGVFAGAAFLYPQRFVARVFAALLADEIGGGDPRAVFQGLGRFDRSGMAWSLLGLFEDDSWVGAHDAQGALAPLWRYLHGADQRGRFELATRVAQAFDQYLTHRPAMIRAWQRGDSEAEDERVAWQRTLWCELRARLGEGAFHVADLEGLFLEHLARAEKLPTVASRVTVFGVSSLSPLYARVVAALAHYADVHLFLLQPSPHYWRDLAAPREIQRAAAAGGDGVSLHLDPTCPLLASLGRLGADFAAVLDDEISHVGASEIEPAGELFRAPRGSHLLARLQRSLYELDVSALPVDPEDRSVTFHSCYGPMREVEVLHDQLLALFDDLDDLAPHEIVVMMSDVELYAPLVEAVFTRENQAIPFRIADRALRRDSAVIESFHRLLALIGGRARASELLDLLALEPLQQRFGIGASEVDTIAGWVVDSSIRWGIDANHRVEHGQPHTPQNTWRFGLERLLLGYAMPGRGEAMFGGVLPYDEVEGQSAHLLGKLSDFCEVVFGAVRALAAPRSLVAWRDALLDLVRATLVLTPDNAWEHQRITAALSEMVELSSTAGFDGEVDIALVRSVLERTIDDAQHERGFLSGGVTFCAMVPMRTIPFRVVCMLGMSDGVFPRRDHVLDFDLMAQSPRRGDRRRRDDDRYLFLEAILSARDRLIISYVGQSIRDGAMLPPSAVVSELRDALTALGATQVAAEGLRGGRDPLVTVHPLQPFSPSYFDDTDARLFSYDPQNCSAAERLSSQARSPAPRVFSRPLAAPDTTTVTADEFLRFFRLPLRALMNVQLGVDLRRSEHDIPDREPLAPKPLEAYEIGDRLLRLRLSGCDRDRAEELLRAAGVLPHGALGHVALDQAMATSALMCERIERARAGDACPSLEVSGRLSDGTELVGQLGDRYPGGLVRHQWSAANGKYALDLWLRHLLCGWLLGEEAGSSLLVARKPASQRSAKRASTESLVWRFTPLSRERCEEHLVDLMELYRLGLSEPLLLFPRAGLAYSERLQRVARKSTADEAHRRALDAARAEWKNESSYEPHLQRVFADEEILAADGLGEPFVGPSFSVLAQRVFTPLLALREAL